MIAYQESYSPAWHEDFINMLPRIRQSARVALLNLPGEARDEAIAEVVASSFVAYARLVELGKPELAYPTVLARYGVAQYRSGRRVGTRANGLCVYSQGARCQNGHELHNIRAAGDYEPWKEQLVENHRTPVPDQAGFRIDLAEFLHALPNRDRDIAEQLAVGHRPGEVARRFGLSDGRVSQLRRELGQDWDAFHGDAEDEESQSDGDLPTSSFVAGDETNAVNRSLAVVGEVI